MSGFFQGMSESLSPHAKKLNDTISIQGAAIYAKLHAIERATLDVGRGDLGDHWDRILIKQKMKAGETIIPREVPLNEIFLIQCIASDGVQEKSPPFVITANGLLVESVVKEGLGFEGISGNQVFMPGEKVEVTAREEGNINCVITIIRRLMPVEKATTQLGRGTEFFSPNNTHEIARDVIMSPNGEWTEPQPETAETEGLKEVVPANQNAFR